MFSFGALVLMGTLVAVIFTICEDFFFAQERSQPQALTPEFLLAAGKATFYSCRLGFFVLAGCVLLHASPPLRSVVRSVVAAPAALVSALALFARDATVTELQQRLADFEANSSTVRPAPTTATTAMRNQLRSQKRSLERQKAQLQSRLDAAEQTIRDCRRTMDQQPPATSAKEARLLEENDSLRADLQVLYGALDSRSTALHSAKHQLSRATKDCEAYRLEKASTDARVTDLETRVTASEAAVRESQAGLFARDQRIAALDTVLEVLFRLSETREQNELTTAVLFARALQRTGVVLSDLGVDAHRLQVLYEWVAVQHMDEILLRPQLGFRLQGRRYPLTGLQLVGTSVLPGRSMPFAPLHPPAVELPSAGALAQFHYAPVLAPAPVQVPAAAPVFPGHFTPRPGQPSLIITTVAPTPAHAPAPIPSPTPACVPATPTPPSTVVAAPVTPAPAPSSGSNAPSRAIAATVPGAGQTLSGAFMSSARPGSFLRK